MSRIILALQGGGHETLAAQPVRAVRRSGSGVELWTARGIERFDHVVMACHADQSLALLQDPSPEERNILGAVRYQHNLSVLHTDSGLMPRSPSAWAAWNYEGTLNAAAEGGPICLHYWLNRLQRTRLKKPVFVSLNPRRAPQPSTVMDRFEYDHPVLDARTLRAQSALPRIQGVQATWYCGAWTGNGFHEDGVRSATGVARGIVQELSASGASSRNEPSQLAWSSG